MLQKGKHRQKPESHFCEDDKKICPPPILHRLYCLFLFETTTYMSQSSSELKKVSEDMKTRVSQRKVKENKIILPKGERLKGDIIQAWVGILHKIWKKTAIPIESGIQI